MFLSRKFFELYCRLVFTFYTPLKVVGKENLPKSSFIICSNHSSHMDTAILGVSTIGFNNLAMMAAKDYWFDNKVRKFFFNIFLNLIPIERVNIQKKPGEKMGINQTIKYCKEFLDQGNRAILIYPEGTRTRTGEIQTFKEGIALFASKLEVPIVPAYINGTFKAWKKGTKFIKPKKITTYIGEPLEFEEIIKIKKNNSKGFFKAIALEIEQRVKKLKEENS